SPGFACLGIAERVQLERDAIGDAELPQQLVAETEQLHIRLRFVRANDLRIELMELAETALLRPFITEGRTGSRHFERRILLPALAQIGAADPGGELRPKRNRFP